MLARLRFLLVGFVTGLYAIAAIGVALFDRGGRRSSAIIGSWARTVLRLAGVSLEVEGRERLPEQGPVLYVSSHRSHLDVPALFCLLPDTSRFVAKRELFRIPVFGQAIGLLGFVPIDRGDKRRAKAALEKAAAKTELNRSIAMFPEGTRNPKAAGLLPFKGGAFALALQNRLPIVTIACVGGGRCLPPRSLRMTPGRMTIRIGRTFQPDEPCYESRSKLSAAVREEMLALLGED